MEKKKLVTCLQATKAAMPQKLGTKTRRVMYKFYQFQA
jgi:hypothetical protein